MLLNDVSLHFWYLFIYFVYPVVYTYAWNQTKVSPVNSTPSEAMPQIDHNATAVWYNGPPNSSEVWGGHQAINYVLPAVEAWSITLRYGYQVDQWNTMAMWAMA